MTNPANHDPLSGAFVQSCEDFEQYPCNLLCREDFEHTLVSYNKRLNKDESSWKLFHNRSRQLWTYDLVNDDDEFRMSPKLETLSQVKNLLPRESRDPRCRHIFIQTPNSRDPLACSKEQLMLLLTYYQVFPAFLDLLFTFRKREKPLLQASFLHEASLGEAQRLRLATQKRSGIRLQHCFNLVGVELDDNKDKNWPWFIRQSAAYHSFDLVENRSVWIVIKGNKLLRERISSATEGYRKRHPDFASTSQGSFLANMRTLLLIFEWCTENWVPYIDFLETKLRRPASLVKTTPVGALTNDEPIARALSRRGTIASSFAASRRSTGLSSPPGSPTSPIPPQGLFQALNATTLGGFSPTSSSNKLDKLDLNEMFTFDELQKLYKLSDQLEDAIMVIDQDSRVLKEIRDYFQELTRSPEFKQHLDLGRRMEDMSDFFKKTRKLERDLANYKARIQTLLHNLEKYITLFNVILQFKSTQTAEFFAKQGQMAAEQGQIYAQDSHDSADRMERWTEKMHDIASKTEKQTVSMHVITILTLLFLPGTFVATFFSTGILDFNGAHVVNFGDWDTRWGALKLFSVICFPIMAFTLAFWYYMSYLRPRWRALASPTRSVSASPDSEKGGMNALGISNS